MGCCTLKHLLELICRARCTCLCPRSVRTIDAPDPLRTKTRSLNAMYCLHHFASLPLLFPAFCLESQHYVIVWPDTE